MKRFTLLTMLVALLSVTAFAQKGLRLLPMKDALQTSSVKMKAIDRKAQPVTNRTRRAGDELVTPPATAKVETWYLTSGKFYIYTSSGWADATSYMPTINVAIDGSDMYIQGLAYWMPEGWIKGKIDGFMVLFDNGQFIGADDDGSEYMVGSNDGSTLSDGILFNYSEEHGVLECVTDFLIENSKADEISPYCYWTKPTFSKDEPAAPEVVVLPEGVESVEYIMAYNDQYNRPNSTPVNVAVDGNDVYFQGISEFLPKAWVKGTKEGNTVTFPAMQYMGEYFSYGSSYAFYEGPAVFTYDAETSTYSAEGEIYGVLADQYYDGHYFDPVLNKVIEKAATPATPVISSVEEDDDYGWYMSFDVPLVDTEGNGMLSSKLSYQIFTDVDQNVSPLTFTSATHTKLTEDMTVIPYGFTDNYDFTKTEIYFNELFSEDWNKIGIQSIYTGGGEEHKSDIFWYTIKEYTRPTFDFNTMDVACSSNGSTAGDITEDFEITAGGVTLTVSPKTEEATSPNRFWGTNNGPQLRVYSGTLTFEAPEGCLITNLQFNHNGKWGSNTADSGELTNDADAKVATWTGSAQKVVVTIGGNSQINSINVVTIEQLVELPEGVTAETWAIDGTFSDNYGGTNIVRQTEAAIVGNDIYVKGIPFYFEESWMKGTIDAETGIATFKSGQFVGEDEYGKEYMVGCDDGETICDIEFVYDAEAKTLTQKTTYILENGDTKDEFNAYGYWTDMYIYAGEAIVIDPVEAPEGLQTDPYILSANVQVTDYDDDYNTILTDPQPYSYQTEVGFDGQDVYIKGISEDTAELWLKGTLSEDGKTVTIPANQFMGTETVLWYLFDYYFTAVDEEGNMVDIVLNYDKEANTFKTSQTLVLHDGKRKLGTPYQVFNDVTITKFVEVAATPATPTIEVVGLSAYGYPIVDFNLPSVGTNDETLLNSKLYYTVWVEKAGEQQQYIFTADKYSNDFTEDVAEVPCSFNGYDFVSYGGGEYRVYFEETETEFQSWAKVGVQAIYYGAGEQRKSSIVWLENSSYEPTGISNINADLKAGKAVIYNINGQRLDAPRKGLNIINGRKVVMK